MLRFRKRTRSARRVQESRYDRLRIELLEDRRLLAVYVVNVDSDLPDLTPRGDGKVDVDVNTPGDQVSLRGAIMDAYFRPGKNTIQFNIPGPGPHVIQPTSPFPEIRYPVKIDGYSQRGAVSNSKTVREGNDAVIMIELDGSKLPLGADGLYISGGQSEVSGLAIHSLRSKPIASYETLGVVIDGEGGAAIQLTGAGGNIIAGNFLGANADGFTMGNSGTGVYVGSSDNVLQANIIVGNMTGVVISGDGVTGNKLFANYIGVGQDGMTPGHNARGVGIYGGAHDTQIGGTAANLGNVISANRQPGVSSFDASGVSIYGFAPGNTIVGSNVVQNNLIGTDRTGKVVDPDGQPKSGDELGNEDFGVQITASINNAISLNVISGNRQSGVLIADPLSKNNYVTGNRIGTDIEGAKALGNELHGVEIQNAPDNFVETNDISGNGTSGVAISGASASGNRIENNQIGSDATGTLKLPNHYHGVQIVDAPRNYIQGNLISGNALVGIHLSGSRAMGNEVVGNQIGTHVDGSQPLGNGFDGIYIYNAPANLIGGATPNQRNVISGNKRHGIMIVGIDAKGNEVSGNYIGTTLDGASPLPNQRDGVVLDGAPENTVGGATSGHRNVISGNLANGIAIVGAGAAKNQILSNYIGVNHVGNAAAMGNGGNGVLIDGALETSVGGPTEQPGQTAKPGESPGNIISDNQASGVEIKGTSATGNQVQGNVIGLNTTGASAGNKRHGVLIDDSAGNLIGDTSSGTFGPADPPVTTNTISWNGGDGVRVQGGSALANTIRRNGIHDNQGLGINLVGRESARQENDNVTPNDTGDGDVGPNGLLNFPVGVTARYDGKYTHISGILSTTKPENCEVDIYVNETIDPTGFGEGAHYVGTAKPTKHGAFHLMVTGELKYPFLSATATDDPTHGATSEFSPVYEKDSDGDGLPDDWERKGLDFNGDGLVDLNLPALGARWNYKDVYLEIDYLQGMQYWDASIATLVQAFKVAPVLNPTAGELGIALHTNTASGGDSISLSAALMDKTGFAEINGADNDIWDLKDRFFGTPADRSSPRIADILGARGLVYHYCIFVNAVAEAVSSSGMGQINGGNFLVALNGIDYDKFGGRVQMEASTVMHELGHNLGLGHGGPVWDGPDVDPQNQLNYKPNYLSVMNYAYMWPDQVRYRPMDYSRLDKDDLAVLDENNLDEDKGIDNGYEVALLGDDPDQWNQVTFASPGAKLSDPILPRKSNSIGWIDWNQDGSNNIFDYSLSIDEEPGAGPPKNAANVLESRDDWRHLIFNFRSSKTNFTGRGSAADDLSEPEPDKTEIETRARLLDVDDDGVSNWDDNAPFVFNPGQADADGDGLGDAGELLSFSLAASSVPGGETTIGTISLLAPAPPDGTRVSLSSSDPFSAILPRAVLIPPGASSVAFTIQAAGHLSANTPVTIYADFFGELRSAELVVGPKVAVSDLEVTKTVAADVNSGGAKLTYTLTVTNHGPDPVVGVELTDTLPANVELISASGSSGVEMVPGPGLNVRFDYTYDTSNFFDTQEKKDVLEAAGRIMVGAMGDDLEAILPDDDNTWTAVFINPSTGEPASVTDLVVPENELVIFVGGRDLGGAVAGSTLVGRGGLGGSTASGTTDFLRAVQTRGEAGADEVTPIDFGRWGGQIAFNTNPEVSFHFGPSTEGLDPDEFDFFTAALHEMTHVLGLGRAESWNTFVDSARGVFTGPASRLEYGGNVPLDPDLVHWADGTVDEGEETLMDPVYSLGTRIYYPTPLDWAGLEDVGWNTNGLLQREKTLPVVERAGSVVFDVGALNPGQVVTATVEVIVTEPGEVVNRASVTSPYLDDPDLSNNQVGPAINVPPGSGIVVNTTDDLDDGVADATHTSLREAINLANQLPGLDTIAFDIPGPGPHTIQPTSALPVITDRVVIDGTTEPDYAGAPVIELDGTLAGPAANGLYVTAGDSRIRGLVINRFGAAESPFTAGNGIVLEGGGNSVIEACYLGTDVTGTVPAGNERAGILVVNSTNNLIGGVTVEARNVISGNGHAGVVLGYGANNNLVQGNYIGTTVGGDVGISATMVGVVIGGTRSNVIGGTIPEARNVISGNQIGVHLQNSQDNLVQGNYIGTTSSGSFGSGSLANFTGVLITGGAKNTIGGVGAGNVISGNQIGIEVTGPYDELSPDLYHRILGNRIGIVPDGTTSLGNVLQGVRISEGGHAVVGGTSPGEGNIIAYNFDGIWCPSGEVVIRGNSIYFNARSGIFVGPPLNDPGDQSPPLNYPVLGLASSDGATTRIEGEINTPFYAVPEGGGDPIAVDVVLDFYANASGDPTEHVQGRTYLGSWTITAPTGTDGKPLLTTSMSFVASLPVDVPEGQRITATTFKGHRSSAFSAAIAVVRDTDGDGVPDWVEDAAPSGGDANADGTPDRLQANVASVSNAVNGRYIVLEAAGDARLEKVAAVRNPSPLDEPPLVTFPFGYLTFQLVVGPTASSGVVRLTGESGADLDAVYGFGPTPDDSAPHWYAFPFDGSTGAEVFADRIDVHLTDSARGDHDLTANGRIVALVAPAIVGPYEGVTFVVNTADDLDDGDLQQLSLREAIIQANLHPGRDRVEFAIPPTSVFTPVRTIQPTSPLPIITDPIIIDGYSQPGAKPATNDERAVQLIELDGSLLDPAAEFPPHGHVGLHITAGHSLVQGLIINRFEKTNQYKPGVAILLQMEGGNVIQGNWLGTSYDGAFAYDNNFVGRGVVIDGSPDNRVGGVVPAARNLISGFHIGIDIRGEASDSNLVQGNYIGTDATGAYIPNGGGRGWLGIGITDGADDNLIGGTVGTTPGGRASGTANVIAGNTYGVFVDGGELTRNNIIQGNYVGVDVTGKYALSNGYGVSARGTGTLVGGTTAAARNILSGNSYDGIDIQLGGGIVQGNYIGTDVSGTRPLGNGHHGISVRSALEDWLIGGDEPGAGNVISASGFSGIHLWGDTAGVTGLKVVIQGNFIGTDVTGTVALGNGTRTDFLDRYRAGIQSEKIDLRVIVGGVSPGAGNLISGNGGDGIIFWNNVYGYLVQGNLIGTDVTGTSPLGNGSAGIHVWSTWWQYHLTNNTIGGTDPGAANTIAFNGTEGVFLEAGKRTTILSNAIFANGTLGIDLGPGLDFDPDGVTPNDPGDEDEGTNDLQNFPVLTGARIEGGTTVDGVLDSLPDRSYRLEFFSSQAVDASGHGEGEVFLGSVDVVTDGSGQGLFSVTLASVVPTGHFITATATSPEGASSEFSQAIAVDGPLVQFDFGDAPAEFPTLLADQGARHVIVPGFYLGASADADSDGRPSDAADGDDLDGSDDEDGVVFAMPLVAGQGAVVDVTASAEGRLDAWIDFDGNGNWEEEEEQVFSNMLLLPGRNTLFFSTASSATVTDRTYARFRFSSTGGLSPRGLALDGEVEDYALAIAAGPAVPAAPVALADQTTTDQATPVAIDVLANDSDADGNLDISTVTLLSDPAHGSAFVDQRSGVVTYRPDPSFTGTDSFSYRISDTDGWFDTALVSVEVLPGNQPPVANDDTPTADEDTPLIIDVIANDTDAEGTLDPTTVAIRVSPSNGFASVDPATGAVTYTPDADFNGTDVFLYEVFDVDGASDWAAVIVTVRAVNDSPEAVNDDATAVFELPVTIDVLANDTDGDQNLDPTTVTVLDEPVGGTVAVDLASGEITYTSFAGFAGIDTFTYEVFDTEGLSDTAIVFVEVLPVNSPPVARDDEATTSENHSVTIDVTVNDSDPDKNLDPTTVQILFAPLRGSVNIDPSTGSITYTSPKGFDQVDWFAYQVSDTHGDSDVAIVAVRVNSINDPPMANDDIAYLDMNTGARLSVLLNDEEIDGTIDPSTLTILSGPNSGTVQVNEEDGTVGYSPNMGFVGADSFTYAVSDDQGAVSNKATVTIFVDRPLTTSISGRKFEDLDGQGPGTDGPGIPGIVIHLFDFDGQLVATTQTATDAPQTTEDEAGQYRFDGLKPGTYFVGEAISSGWTQSYPDDRGISVGDGVIAGGTHVVTVGLEHPADGIDFGNYREGGTASIRGFVYVDVNNDGIKEPSEMSLPGVPVWIDGPSSQHQVTADDGSYAFVDLPPGNYLLGQTQPGAFLDGSERPGTPLLGHVQNDRFVDLALAAGTEAVDYNFGERGLIPELISKRLLLASTPPMDELLLTFTLSDRDAWLNFQATEDAILSAELSGYDGAEPLIELYNSRWVPLALSGGQTSMEAPVVAGETYVLHVAGDRADVNLQFTNPLDQTGNRKLVFGIAFDDQYSATEDETLVVPADDGLLGNDHDPDDGALHVESIVPPAHGELHLLRDGSFTYAPKSMFNREDVFTYVASNGTVDSQPAAVQIVMETAFPWYNGLNPFNVNDDNFVSPMDVLAIINALNRGDGGRLPLDRTRPLTKPFYDVNRDGLLSPIDALLVINFLNRDGGEGEMAGNSTAATVATTRLFAAPPVGSDYAMDDVAAKVSAARARTAEPYPSTDILQSLDLFFTKLGCTDDIQTGVTPVERRKMGAEDLEWLFEQMLGKDIDWKSDRVVMDHCEYPQIRHRH